MKVNAIHEKFGRNCCVIEPIFFPKETGLQFKVVKGDYKGSLFACKKNEFTFSKCAKFKVFLIETAYFISAVLCRKLFHQIPHKIKMYFTTKTVIPF